MKGERALTGPLPPSWFCLCEGGELGRLAGRARWSAAPLLPLPSTAHPPIPPTCRLLVQLQEHIQAAGGAAATGVAAD